MPDPAWLVKMRADGRITERGVNSEALASVRLDGETHCVEPEKLCQRKPKAMIAPNWAIELTIPVQVVSEANSRVHWAKRHRRFKDQGNALCAAMYSLAPGRHWEQLGRRSGVLITFTRLGPQKLDDDNLAGAFKGLRDKVASLLDIDDGDARLTWVYRQEQNKLSGVRVRIEKDGAK